MTGFRRIIASYNDNLGAPAVLLLVVGFIGVLSLASRRYSPPLGSSHTFAAQV